jgi:hypothetical protein
MMPGGPLMPGAGGDVNTTLPLILNIVAAVFCSGTCLGTVIAVVGIVFAVQAGNLKNAGDIAGAQAKAKSSTTMAIVSMVLGFVLYILITALRVAASS